MAIALVTAALEIAALFGLADYRLVFHNPIGAPWQDPAYRFDADLLFRRPAHQTVTGSSYGDIARRFRVPAAQPYDFEMRFDANGFRNPVDHVQADVVLVGDAFVEAGLVAVEDHVATRLGAARGETVVSLGSTGYGPQQQLVLVRDYAIPLAPHTIVWLFFEGDDLLDIPTFDSLHADRRREHGRVPWWDRSFARNALVRLTTSVGSRPTATDRSGVVRAGTGDERTYFLYTTPGLRPFEEQMLERLRDMLADAWALAEPRHVGLLVAYVPVKYRVYRDRLVESGPVTATWTTNDLPARIERMVHAISPDIGFIDLTPAFQEALDASAPPWFPDDSHWNGAGHRVAAFAIGQAIHAMLFPTGS